MKCVPGLGIELQSRSVDHIGTKISDSRGTAVEEDTHSNGLLC